MTFKLGDLAPTIEKRACWRKVAYDTREQAEAAREWMVERRVGDWQTLHSYICHDCQRFHVGHNRGGERDMSDVREALQDGGVLAVFLGTNHDHDIPIDFRRHPQVHAVAANTLTPAKVQAELANAKAAVLTDNIDHRIYLAINSELRRRKLVYVLRKTKAQVEETLQEVFPSAKAAQPEPVPVPLQVSAPEPPKAAPPVVPKEIAKRGTLKAFVEEHWTEIEALSTAEGARVLFARAVAGGLTTTQASVEQYIRNKRRKLQEIAAGGPTSTSAVDVLDEVIAGLELLREHVAEMESRHSALVAEAAKAKDLQTTLDGIRKQLGMG